MMPDWYSFVLYSQVHCARKLNFINSIHISCNIITQLLIVMKSRYCVFCNYLIVFNIYIYQKKLNTVLLRLLCYILQCKIYNWQILPDELIFILFILQMMKVIHSESNREMVLIRNK